MPIVTVDSENSGTVDLYYEDHGSGQPVVLIHGFPLNGQSWEKQSLALLDAGYRVITYDRRGFGRSSQPTFGYDYDTFARDLNTILIALDLADVVLAGFSMGTGEVTRYIGHYGTERIGKAALLGPIPPFLLRTAGNTEGVDQAVFDGIRQAILDDRPAFIRRFFEDFYNVDQLRPERVSDERLRADFAVGVSASARGTWACVDTWLTDFRPDLARFDIPTLVIQGDADRILPYEATGKRLRAFLPDATHVVIPGGPHAIGWTHADEVTRHLLAFLAG